MSKNAKSEALKKKLGNVVCAKCEGKHKTKDHKDEYDEYEKDTEKRNSKEENGDQE